MESEDRLWRIMSSNAQPPDSIEPASTTPPQPPRMSKTAHQGIYGMIMVKVGAEEKQYLLHSAFLIYYSDTISLRLPGRATIHLEDVRPEVFDIFVDWMYTQKLPQPSQWDCLLIAKCYNFAGRYWASLFKEATGNAFVDKAFFEEVTPYYPTIIFAYENTHISPIVQDRLIGFLIDYHCDRYRHEGAYNQHPSMRLDDETAEKIPTKFWMAVTERYARISIGYADAEMGQRKEYHEHTKQEDRDGCGVCR